MPSREQRSSIEPESAEPESAEPESAEGRRYGGAEADERRARRRRAFIDAGLQLFGELGYPAVTVKRLCDEAGLTQRYFYESFADRPALLIAVYEHCVEVTRTATVGAAAEYLLDPAGVAPDAVHAAARDTLGAFLATLTGDPRRARVMLVEVVGVDPTVESTRLRAIHNWASLILALAMGEREVSPAQHLAAVGLVGAVTQLLVDWYFTNVAPDPVDIGAEPTDLDVVLDVCVDMFGATYDQLMR
ncbi:TetR/AcrR family transcriptional regulator [Gordonia polyisoprenivorans]|nr:TetR/AcrR family transcriptional regulator [Gordonia polyisoprenivorans]